MKNQLSNTALAGTALILLSKLSTGCRTTFPKDSPVGPKTYKIKTEIKLNGFHRTYLVHIPSGYHPEKPLSLVVVIHGAFDTAKGMEKFSGFSSL